MAMLRQWKCVDDNTDNPLSCDFPELILMVRHKQIQLQKNKFNMFYVKVRNKQLRRNHVFKIVNDQGPIRMIVCIKL